MEQVATAAAVFVLYYTNLTNWSLSLYMYIYLVCGWEVVGSDANVDVYGSPKAVVIIR